MYNRNRSNVNFLVGIVVCAKYVKHKDNSKGRKKGEGIENRRPKKDCK